MQSERSLPTSPSQGTLSAEMPIYMVERNFPGITMEQLAGAQQAAMETGKRMTAERKKVRYIRSTFVPSEARFPAEAKSIISLLRPLTT